MPEFREAFNFDALTPEELELERRKYKELLDARNADRLAGKPLPPGVPSDPRHPPLTDEELHSWYEITRQLRKRNSGPRKAAKAAKTPKATSATELEI